MPIGGSPDRGPDLLVDTSVALALCSLGHGVPLVTRDTRALATYRAIGTTLVVVR